jgi:hypothetical protein
MNSDGRSFRTLIRHWEGEVLAALIENGEDLFRTCQLIRLSFGQSEKGPRHCGDAAAELAA